MCEGKRESHLKTVQNQRKKIERELQEIDERERRLNYGCYVCGKSFDDHPFVNYDINDRKFYIHLECYEKYKSYLVE